MYSLIWSPSLLFCRPLPACWRLGCICRRIVISFWTLVNGSDNNKRVHNLLQAMAFLMPDRAATMTVCRSVVAYPSKHTLNPKPQTNLLVHYTPCMSLALGFGQRVDSACCACDKVQKAECTAATKLLLLVSIFQVFKQIKRHLNLTHFFRLCQLDTCFQSLSALILTRHCLRCCAYACLGQAATQNCTYLTPGTYTYSMMN